MAIINMKKLIRSIGKKLYFFPGALYNRFIFLLKGVKVGKNFQAVGRIWVKNKGIITIGNDVRVRSSANSNPIGRGQRVYLRTLKTGIISIGNNVGMSNTAIVSASEGGIQIKDQVMIGGGVCIYDTDFHSINPYMRLHLSTVPEIVKSKPIVIQKRAFIGAGSIILKGSTIGENTIIGAGSVVAGNIPGNQVWAGNPASYIRDLTEEELEYV